MFAYTNLGRTDEQQSDMPAGACQPARPLGWRADHPGRRRTCLKSSPGGTKSPITPADQAEAYFLLISQRLSKTTGQVITVDGGLHEAFLR